MMGPSNSVLLVRTHGRLRGGNAALRVSGETIRKMIPRVPTRALSRRQFFGRSAALGSGALLCSSLAPARFDGKSIKPYREHLSVLRDRILQKLNECVAVGQLRRDDGFIYTIDAAQTFLCFALAGDSGGYETLRAHCLSNLICDAGNDPFCRGFVAWRYKPGQPVDASGTTEALRMARAFWIGSERFQRPDDARIARIVLHGYANHATIDQGVWIVRNYFTFKTRSFAPNSFLVDYDPDFVREVSLKLGDNDLKEVADKSDALISRAVTPCGLLYDLVQPDLKTLYPLLDVYTFSPNDVVGLTGCGTTALGVTRSNPQIGRKILAFATKRFGGLRRYYYGRTGEPVDSSSAAIFEYSTLARLAAQLGDEPAAARIVDRGLIEWQWLLDHDRTPSPFILTELYQTLQALVEIGKPVH